MQAKERKQNSHFTTNIVHKSLGLSFKFIHVLDSKKKIAAVLVKMKSHVVTCTCMHLYTCTCTLNGRTRKQHMHTSYKCRISISSPLSPRSRGGKGTCLFQSAACRPTYKMSTRPVKLLQNGAKWESEWVGEREVWDTVGSPATTSIYLHYQRLYNKTKIIQ